MNDKLRAARRARCWSQSEAAEKAEVDVQTYARWEKGQQVPHPHNLDLLCKAFHLSSVDLGFAQEAVQSPEQSAHNGGVIMLTAEEAREISLLLGLGGNGNDMMKQFDSSKRQAIQKLLGAAGLAVVAPQALANPEPWERLARAADQPATMNAAAFRHFEQMTAQCWELSNSGELEVAERVLSTFLPRFRELAPYQPQAAELATQGLRLRSVLVAHQLKVFEKATLCQQAVEYARQAKNPNTLVGALAELAVAYRYTGQSEEELRTCQEALYYIDQASPLLSSRIYAHAAKTFGEHNRKREANFYMQLAYDTFPSQPKDDPYFALANCNIFTLILYQGLMHIGLNQPVDAWNAFDSVKKYQSEIPAPERIRLEIANFQGRAAILSGDMDKYALCLEDGISGAVALGSRKRFDEAYSILRQEAPGGWLREAPVRGIVEQYDLAV